MLRRCPGVFVLIICWSAKGGSGTTVISCALALLAARKRATLLVDLAGDTPAALGIAEVTSPGIHDWVLTDTATPQALQGLGVAVQDNLRLLPRGKNSAPSNHPRWQLAASSLYASSADVVVDAGTSPPPDLFDIADQRLLVTQACYLALRRHSASGLTPTGIILQQQPGRALRVNDVMHAVQAPVVAEVSFDVHVARAVDAGLLATRMPRELSHGLRHVLEMSEAA
jgi:CobQ/CobB/MinD/ParA nucleotide binding domain